MKCQKCNRQMIQLLNSCVCDHCDKKSFENDIRKLTAVKGDLLIVKMPLDATDEMYDSVLDLINNCELEARCIVIPENIDIEHIKLK